MIDLATPEALWTLTNQCIAAVVVVSGLVVAYDIARQLQLHFQPKRQPVRFDDHSFFVPELGLTMADGGERIDPAKPTEASPDSQTPPSPPAET